MANDGSRMDINEPQSCRLDTNDGTLNLGRGALGNEKCLYMICIWERVARSCG